MKKLYLARHAKSSWKEPDLDDFDRPLNKRGIRDAPFIGQKLKEKNILPDLIISSPANRALTTARELAEQMGYPVDKIVEDENIYEAGGGELLSIIQNVSDEHESLMLVGHNPEFTMLANWLGGLTIPNVPTCGMVALTFEGDSWQQVQGGKGSLLFFEYPKKNI